MTRGKAPGEYGLSADFIKNTRKFTAERRKKLFSAYKKKGHFPKVWKQTYIPINGINNRADLKTFEVRLSLVDSIQTVSQVTEKTKE